MSLAESSSYNSSYVNAGIVGGQNYVTFGAVPPYSMGLWDLKINSLSYSVSALSQNICFDFVAGSKKATKKLAAFD